MTWIPFKQRRVTSESVSFSGSIKHREQQGIETASLRLRLVSTYFLLSGVGVSLQVIAFSFALISGAMGIGASPLLALFLVPRILMALGYFWTGRELRRRRRGAWISAVIAFAAALIPTGRPFSSFTLGFAIFGLLLLLSVRRELDESTVPEDDD